MTNERDSTMTLGQVRDKLRILAEMCGDQPHLGYNQYADAIDAHLATRDAVVSDEAVAYHVPNAMHAQDGSFEDGPGYYVYAAEASDYEKKIGFPLFTNPLASRKVAVPDGWVKGKYGYAQLFNAIGSAVEWKEHKTLGISVEKFEEAMLASQGEVK